MPEKKVLMVLYEFPPEGSRGTKRAIKFIKHLGGQGFSPAVLTAKDPNYEFHDGSLLAELPSGLPIHRAFTLESLFYRTPLKPGHVIDTGSQKRDRSRKGPMRRAALGLYHFFGRTLRITDSRILWLPFAVAKGWSVIRREKVDLIFASGPSFTNHLVGALLKRLTRRPLVIDFRDAWANDPARKSASGWHHRVSLAAERFAVRTADRVVSTTDGIRDDFVARYPRLAGRFVTVTNGFDAEDFAEIPPAHKPPGPRRMVVVHAGTLGGERSPKEFLEGLAALFRADPAARDRIEIDFVGQNSPFRDGTTIEEHISRLGLAGSVHLKGFVARKESLRLITEGDLLLLLIGRVPREETAHYGISAKIYDYAVGGKPVLTVSEEGASARMARHLNLGAVLHPDDPSGIASALAGYLAEFEARGELKSSVDRAALAQFEFSSLTSRLAAQFREVIHPRGATGGVSECQPKV